MAASEDRGTDFSRFGDPTLDPHFDFDRLTTEEAYAIQDARRTHDILHVSLTHAEGDERVLACAKDYLRFTHEYGDVLAEIQKKKFIVPMFVHTVGEVEDVRPHDIEAGAPESARVQYCTNCDRPLRTFVPGMVVNTETWEPVPENEWNWAPVGEQLAISADSARSDLQYVIVDREPDDFERRCVGKEQLG